MSRRTNRVSHADEPAQRATRSNQVKAGWRIGVLTAVVAAAAIVVVAVHRHGSSTPKDNSVALAQELATLANRSTHTSWLVTFAFTRTTATGDKLHDTVLGAHYASPKPSQPSLDIDDGLGSLVVTAGDTTYSCTAVGSTPQCLQRAAGDSTSKPGSVYGGAVISGDYSIARAPGVTIAGLAARCFTLRRLHGNPIPGLGFSSEQCYSSAGVPLESRLQNSGALDERVAQTVRRVIGRTDLLPLLSPYGLSRFAPAG
jgi:hypothetical protein